MKEKLQNLKNTEFKFIAVLILLLGVSFTARSESLPFANGSLTEILDAKHGQPVMLVLWSVECGSCIKELNVVSEIRRNNPGLSIVMISTDESSESAKVGEMLAQHGMQDIESWIFADPDKQRLRYEVDPTWYGELPRTYFYDKDHKRTAVSGIVKSITIDEWLASQSAS